MFAELSVRGGKNGSMQNLVQHYGYAALFFLAVLESMCIPIPSEATFGFGGAMCTTIVGGDHPLNIAVVIVVGVVGSLIGSIIAYEVGRSAGRSIVDRWGKWILLTHKDLDRAEAWFAKYGAVSVLVGRIIPVVRTVISLPAGLAEMNRARFMVLTTIGCAAWVSLLVGLGYAAGENWEHVAKVFHVIQWPVLGALIIVGAWGLWRRWQAVHGSTGKHAKQ